MHGVGASGLFFIRAHPVQAAHENVAEDDSIHGFHGQRQRQLEARVGFQAA